MKTRGETTTCYRRPCWAVSVPLEDLARHDSEFHPRVHPANVRDMEEARAMRVDEPSTFRRIE